MTQRQGIVLPEWVNDFSPLVSATLALIVDGDITHVCLREVSEFTSRTGVDILRRRPGIFTLPREMRCNFIPLAFSAPSQD